MSLKAALLFGAALGLVPGAAWGQSTTGPSAPQPARDPSRAASPPSQAERSARLDDVTVSARSTDVRTSIDAVSYSLAEDLQASTGSLADALRNVPSVDVDPEGNVSLRGDSNVTILVDGRPSGILSGQSRSQALLQLPASQYARIEVMTNPSAAYSPEGSGGVINLISKPTAPRSGLQTTGSLRANIGDNGRWNAAVSGSRQEGRLTLSGDLSYRSDPTNLEITRRREQLNPTTGAVVATRNTDLDIQSDQASAIGRLTAEYRLTDRTRLTGELRGSAFGSDGQSLGLFETFNASGGLDNAYRREGRSALDTDNLGFTGRLLHRFDEAGHEWSNELRYDRNRNDTDFLSLNRFLNPVLPDLFERSVQSVDQVTAAFTNAYVQPFAEGSRLRAGYDLNIQSPEQDFDLRRGGTVSTLLRVAALSNRFEARQTVHALYATYERPLTEKLTAQAGLRLEQADVEIEDLTGGLSASQDYFRVYPTAHINYALSDIQSLRASYSRRIQRPQLAQLNPFVAYQDPLNLRSGNPDLEPQETDSFEVMWQFRQGQTFYQATAYLRDTEGAFTEVATDVGGGVLLTRPENLGSRRDTGVELTANGRLHETVSYSASVNVFRQQVDAAGIPGGGEREATLASGRVSFNWQPTAKDFVQVSGFWQGETLLAQGVREAGGMLNLGYRRKLTDKLSLNITGRDLLNSFSTSVRYDTPLFRERFEQDIRLRAVYIGLSYTFGADPRRQPEQFDFSTGPAGG